MENTAAQQDSSRTLVKRAGAGDRLAFDALATRHRRALLSYIHQRMAPDFRRAMAPEDILQETLAKAFSSMTRFEWRDADSFGKWLSGIAENLILHHARSYRRREKVPLEEDVPASTSSPSRGLRREERFERLEEAVRHLSAAHREVILLTRIQGLPVEEVAQRMRRSPRAVRQLLWRALKELRRRFGNTESFRLPENRSLGEPGEDESSSGS